MFSKNHIFHCVPDRSKFGGVDVSIKDEFSSIVMDKYKFTSTNKVEILWLEVSTNNRKYIVAGIYSLLRPCVHLNGHPVFSS